ncbi:hypothetical protein PDQ70_27945, partial [Bacillus cereus group sp. Bc011]|nr:hypothetical protein [Bacillus cereus group sp. Bc032]MDA2677687.1 hypothetical protein [Bacillus cereus group sp. Bc031]MDA2683196.1 hypothetical protein [Bacillus cereus group sp. Bc029]MDA2688634.1 hypothetical protein [Bacillus cereus group sp. Bc030]MDA2744166.1 hypothetical protein [Bacillus cereus group sp. Bc011]MDA2749607.1 hypothetical protein [Bacillus cereus group sp. Bc009]
MSMKKRKWLKTMFTGCVLGSLLITAACSGKKTSTEDDKTIKVGVLASITGPLESYGKQTVNGFELGLDYHAHQLKNFHYPQVTKNVILSKKLAR